MSPGAQGEIKVAIDLIAALRQGRRPVFDSSCTSLLMRVKERMPYYARRGDGPGAKVGLTAVQHDLAGLRGKTDLTMTDLELVTSFAWLLSPEENKEVA